MKQVDLSISTLKANLLAPLVAFPIGGVLGAAFGLVWGAERLTDAFEVAFAAQPGRSLLVFVAGILVHELLHGIGWVVASGKGWGPVSFGFQLRTLTPYAHIEEPISVRAYRIGTALPGVVLGLLPWLLGMLIGGGLFHLFGMLFAMLASGDLMVLWLLRRVRPDQQARDHPERAGAYVFVDDEA